MFRYAGTVMDVCKVNQELNRHLEDVAAFTAQVRGGWLEVSPPHCPGWLMGRRFAGCLFYRGFFFPGPP